MEAVDFIAPGQELERPQKQKTAKAFVYLGESDDNHALMITLLGQVIELEEKLFIAPQETDDGESARARGKNQ